MNLHETKTGNILIVDDKPENLTVLRQMLTEQGYLVRTTLSGEMALQTVDANLPDLILLDIMMPDMDGYEVCRRLKMDKRSRDIPILFISALDAITDKVIAFEAGGLDFITKPFHEEEVLARVKTHLELRFSQLELLKHSDHLEDLVKERTIELIHTNKQLEHEIEERKSAEKALRESDTAYRSFAKIGLALSSEKKITKLLEMILDEAINLSNADAGSLYLLENDKKHLRFEIFYNKTLKIRQVGTIGEASGIKKIPLFVNNTPNHANISSYAALRNKVVNIENISQYKKFNFIGPKKFDAQTGYHTQSMLVVPMQNDEAEILGVLQLINSKEKDSDKIIAFSSDCVELIRSLSSQAGVALSNIQLNKDLKNSFDGIIQTVATAIDEKSPYTGGHIRRVVSLTETIAKTINESEQEPFKDITLTEDALEELRISAWMHDVGKITTPEYVVDKSTKLSTIFDRIHLINTRFQLIGKIFECEHCLKKKAFYSDESEVDFSQTDQALSEKLTYLSKQLNFINNSNNSGGFMRQEDVEQIQKIASHQYTLNGNKTHPYLMEDEVNNLCITKGTLTNEEREKIEHHAVMTYKLLCQIPFPKKLANVPIYASQHHEKLDGTGYPMKLCAAEIPLQSKIIAFADIFEALTAKDRPYRKPLKLSQVIKIIGFMKKDNHIDPDIYNLFIKYKLHVDYAKHELGSDQIDI